jgi:DNA gyrase subunit A
MTESGNVKRIPATSFKVSNRNTKGVKTQDDITSCVIRTNTVDTLLVFTNKGTMYRLLVDNIPEGTNSAKGTSLKALIEMEADEKPQVIYSINKGTDAQYVLFLTKNGVIKKTPIDEYIGTKRSGVVATKLREGDSLAAIALVSNEDLVLYTAKGQGIRFNSKEVTATSRNTVGVKGITLNDGDSVLGMAVVRDSNDDVAVFAKNGMGLKIKLADLTAQSRGGKGVILHKEGLAGVALVNDSDNLLICGNTSSICISAKDVPMLNRGAQGNIIIKANNIQSVSKI